MWCPRGQALPWVRPLVVLLAIRTVPELEPTPIPGAPLRKQSWSGRPLPSLPAPKQSSLPGGRILVRSGGGGAGVPYAELPGGSGGRQGHPPQANLDDGPAAASRMHWGPGARDALSAESPQDGQHWHSIIGESQRHKRSSAALSEDDRSGPTAWK